ncbi:hypothetical protein J41TS2_24510 [Bacillus sonorensis]|nr:hypothetical protein J41TS2_24510 [Bacillus sonorensis]
MGEALQLIKYLLIILVLSLVSIIMFNLIFTLSQSIILVLSALLISFMLGWEFRDIDVWEKY